MFFGYSQNFCGLEGRFTDVRGEVIFDFSDGFEGFVLGVFKLGFGNVTLRFHEVKDKISAIFCRFRVVFGVKSGRIFGYAGDSRALGKRQIGNFFSEVIFGRALHAVVSAAEVYDVEIHLENLIFVVNRFHFLSYRHFVDFALECFFGGKLRVFDKLLSYRRGAFGHFFGFEVFDYGAGNALVVNAAVAVKSLVLNGYERIYKILRHFGQRNVAFEFENFAPKAVGYHGCGAVLRQRFHVDFRLGFKASETEKTDACHKQAEHRN